MKVTNNGIDIITFDDVMIVDDFNIEELLLHMIVTRATQEQILELIPCLI